MIMDASLQKLLIRTLHYFNPAKAVQFNGTHGNVLLKELSTPVIRKNGYPEDSSGNHSLAWDQLSRANNWI